METWWHQNTDGSLNLEKLREVLMRHVPQGSDAHFGLDVIMARIAALEAEKAEREAQEPVAWQWLTSGHFRKFPPNDATRKDWRRLYAAPPVPHVDPDWLTNAISSHFSAQIGRGVSMDDCDLLAEKIAEAINGRAK